MIDATVLVIDDDDDDILLSARLFLKQHFNQVITCKSPKEINVLLSRNEVDIILLDMNYQKGASDGREGIYWLEHILSIDKDYVVILMTAYGNVELAVQAIKKGATDFILKPWENEKLFATLSAASRLRQSNKKVKKLERIHSSLQKDINRQFENIVGNSEPIKHLQNTLVKVAPTDANVLILGENGTGKQVFAYELHKLSHRKNQIFMHVDLGSLNENLFESELFGYAKGAFTDAKDDKPGRFEMAEGGTIFLDEIGNLSLPLQAKLLSVIQNRTVNRLGESKERKINVRLITATNMPLNEMVSKGTFRQDLLFRINTVELLLPGLAQRGDDILLLANHFLNTFSTKYHKSIIDFEAKAESMLLNYHWPGNVRELQHVVERAVIMSDSLKIGVNDLQLSPQKFGGTAPIQSDMGLEEMEKLMVQKAIDKHKGNISRAAADLGLTRAALYRRIEKFDL
ncbi:sigma-54-dependent Fis family transcriptional regulator [Pedobacter ginsengisoli]|uniref:Sigma-54-dependent Fis family transcriptional regulator n=1 Tax=Pedobacter ginsengisoli TaxID=363852 RepID=A0A2D1U678_9SPHI|nr:sigma-54 dependent transcriptional regulator [Pedobacter ginsengisoli]ATP57098.1 sigma-54-dependent Fis family transcriptional regulator [Pedobacter ginsengisoli]